MNENYTLSDLPKIAEKIINTAKHKKILFYAEMGVGKTTLIKEICKQLGVVDVISSPTFALVNEYYSSSNGAIYHFDFYRIENEEEAYDIGIEDYFNNDAWCFIEWPENIENLLPLDSVVIRLSKEENNLRNIQLNQN